MKHRTWTCVAVLACVIQVSLTFADNGTPATFDHSHAPFTAILQKHVVGGVVDYQALLEDRAELDGYLRTMAQARLQDFQRWGNEEQLAYLINLYNADTLQPRAAQTSAK
jgi:hypothetical protein